MAISLVLTACDIDNYDAPNAGIYGALIDAETGDTVYTEQPDGAHIRLLDKSYANPTPLDFWAKADGTFRNVALFRGSYQVYPYEGPFFPTDGDLVELKGVGRHDFKVVPFIKVKVTGLELSEGKLTVRYTLKRSATPEGMTIGKKTISEVQVLVNTKPVVSVYNGGYEEALVKKRILSRTSDDKLEAAEQSTTIEGLTAGQTYYVRVAALSSNSYNSALKRYNYSAKLCFVAQ